MTGPARKKPPPRGAGHARSKTKVEWYSRDPGAENFAIVDVNGKILAQVKIMGHPGLAEEIITALSGKAK